MPKPARSLLASLAALALAGCTAGEMAPAVDLEAEAEAIEARSATWMRAVQARDAAAVAALFAPDGEILQQGQAPIMGPAAVEGAVEEEWTAYPDFTVSWTTNRVEVADSGDLAYERGSWTADPDGPGDEPEEHGEYVTIWRKMDGEWVVAFDAGVSTDPEGEDEGDEADEAA